VTLAPRSVRRTDPVNLPAQSQRPAAGFTLIELMVVVVIIGVVITATLLSLGATGRDSQLEQERDRLAALIDYVRERAGLQTVLIDADTGMTRRAKVPPKILACARAPPESMAT